MLPSSPSICLFVGFFLLRILVSIELLPKGCYYRNKSFNLMPVYSLIIFVAFRRLTSKEAGYVPANYVKEIEARTVKKATKQKVMVPEKVRVKRRVIKKVIVQKQRAVKVQKTPEKKGVWNCLVPHIFFEQLLEQKQGPKWGRKSKKRRFMNLKSRRFRFIVCPEIFNSKSRVNILYPNECSRINWTV